MYTILLTGGNGYIGSHTCVELLNMGYNVIIADNLCNSKKDTIKGIEKITGKKPKFYKVDLCDKSKLDKVFAENMIDGVIHFAGYKAVGESVEHPLKYYQNNLTSTMNLLDVMSKYNIKNIIFSSSCTVYGQPKVLPVTENSPVGWSNPYGHTKLIQEEMFANMHTADDSWNIVLLRYFNPVGNHHSALIGENPDNLKQLFPFLVQVASGKIKELNIFGNDYDTPDGTAIRDYIHVVDLATAHVKSLTKCKGLSVYNIGTGRGYSVLEIVNTFMRVNGVKVPYVFKPRRGGDIPQIYADPSFAEKALGWKANKTLEDMCRDAWEWEIKRKK